MIAGGLEFCGTTADGRDVSLRALNPNDIPFLAEAFGNMDPWHRLGMGYDHLARFFGTTQSNRARRVVLIDGQICGIVMTEAPWLFGVYLKFFGLFEDIQGLGVGSLLLKYLIDRARHQGLRNYWVMTSAFNTGAIALYERHGFENVAVLPDLIVAGDDEILFRQLL